MRRKSSAKNFTITSPTSIVAMRHSPTNMPQTLEEENEFLGTSSSQSIVEDENGAFAVGNYRYIRSPGLRDTAVKSFITNNTNDNDITLTKRESEHSLNFANTVGSYALHGYAQSVDHNYNVESQ